jgi:ABC-type sugar transport system substrate-binding protein
MARALSRLIAVAIAAACAGALMTTANPASAQQKKQYAQNGEKPLKGVIRYRRPGGYSYKSNDTAGTGALWKFIDPDSTRQGNPSGPFDSGFFFDSGNGPRGGQSPYQN